MPSSVICPPARDGVSTLRSRSRLMISERPSRRKGGDGSSTLEMAERPPDHHRRLIGDEDMREIAVGAQRRDLGGLGEHGLLRRPERDHAGSGRTPIELALGARERFGKTPGLDRLQQIIHRVHREGLDRMFGVGGDEDDDRRPLQRGKKIEAVAAAQLDVEEDELRRGPLDGLHRLGEARGLADDLGVGMRGQQAPHRLARQMLVVDDQDPHGSPSSTSVATTLFSPAPRSASVNWWRPG